MVQETTIWLRPIRGRTFGFYPLLQSGYFMMEHQSEITGIPAADLMRQFWIVRFLDRPEAKTGLASLGVGLAWCIGGFRLILQCV